MWLIKDIFEFPVSWDKYTLQHVGFSTILTFQWLRVLILIYEARGTIFECWMTRPRVSSGTLFKTLVKAFILNRVDKNVRIKIEHPHLN